jgi:outer membrane protein assembly factor BamA
MGRRQQRCALAIGIGLLTTPGLRAQQNDPHETPEVRRLVLSGVSHVDARDLLKSIATQPSQCKNLIFQIFCSFSNSPAFVDKHYLDRTELRRDPLRIRVYYYKRGYRAVRVDTSVTPEGKGGVRVTFNVTEGEPTRVGRIAITYDSTLISEKTRQKRTLLHAGDPLNLVMLDSMRVLFQQELWDRGYADAAVDTTVTVNEPQTLADVQVKLTQNRLTTVGTISVAGAERVSVPTILNSITLRPGNLFRQSDVLESQRNLYESNMFRQATIVVPPQRDTVKNVEISVAEAPLHEARVATGLTNMDFVQVETRYSAFNLLGGARRLDFTATAGNLLASSLQGRGFFRNLRSDLPDTSRLSSYLLPTWSATLDFKQPSFLHRPANAIGAGVFGHRQANPGIFIDRGYGTTGTFTRQIALRAPISLNYRFEINRVQASDVYFCVNYGVCDTVTIGSLRAHQSLSPLSLTGFIDRSDKPFSPTKGYVARADFEHASSVTGSDYRYNRAFFDAAAYTHRSGGLAVYSAHLRLGFVRALAGGRIGSSVLGPGLGVLHPRKRFYAGGAQSVRGYSENQLGPRILTISPEKLARVKAANGAACDTLSEAVRSCDPNTGGLSDADFIPQALGGTSLIEGSVEWRHPLPFYNGRFTAALFVDGGIVGESALQSLSDIQRIARGTSAVTPGFGIRYESPVGPIRFDMGINPKSTESLPVVTSIVENGQPKIVSLTTLRTYSPGGHTLLSRLTLHFSIGQAY